MYGEREKWDWVSHLLCPGCRYPIVVWSLLNLPFMMHVLVEFSCLKYKRVWEGKCEEGLLTFPLVLKGEVISSGSLWDLDVIVFVPKKTH